MSNPCIFLDRDGVINQDRPNYVYDLAHFVILDGVVEALKDFKNHGYYLVVITNQSGVAQGLYTRQDVSRCHDFLQRSCGHIIDHIYYSPWHPSMTESLSRKPGALLFEKAMARFDIDPVKSWMIGDKERDLIPAKILGMRTILVDGGESTYADFSTADLPAAKSLILSHEQDH